MASALKRAVAAPLLSTTTRRTVTRSTVTTIGRVLRPANFQPVGEDGGKIMYLNVAVDAYAQKSGEKGPSIVQTFSLPIKSEAQENFWASITPGSIVHGQGLFTESSIDTSGMPDYGPKLRLRCTFIDLVHGKEESSSARQL